MLSNWRLKFLVIGEKLKTCLLGLSSTSSAFDKILRRTQHGLGCHSTGAAVGRSTSQQTIQEIIYEDPQQNMVWKRGQERCSLAGFSQVIHVSYGISFKTRLYFFASVVMLCGDSNALIWFVVEPYPRSMTIVPFCISWKTKTWKKPPRNNLSRLDECTMTSYVAVWYIASVCLPSWHAWYIRQVLCPLQNL